jgi:hypothetical protein
VRNAIHKVLKLASILGKSNEMSNCFSRIMNADKSDRTELWDRGSAYWILNNGKVESPASIFPICTSSPSLYGSAIG